VDGFTDTRAALKRAPPLAEQNALQEGLTTQAAADIIYALASHEVYLRLTRQCGWSSHRHTDWLTTTLQATLLEQDP
jgi:hypothetical protein